MEAKYLYKAASLAGLILSGVGTLLGSWAADKEKQNEINKAVIKALEKSKK